MNYKVIFIPAYGQEAKFEQQCKTIEEAEAILNAIGNYTLLLHECSFMEDFSNAGMVCKKDKDGEWVEIDEDENEI